MSYVRVLFPGQPDEGWDSDSDDIDADARRGTFVASNLLECAGEGWTDEVVRSRTIKKRLELVCLVSSSSTTTNSCWGFMVVSMGA